jgi:hypothetical protein
VIMPTASVKIFASSNALNKWRLIAGTREADP